jgi:hypothetical protein
MGANGAVAVSCPLVFKNIIEKIFNVKTKVIENPITGKPLVIYS